MLNFKQLKLIESENLDPPSPTVVERIVSEVSDYALKQLRLSEFEIEAPAEPLISDSVVEQITSEVADYVLNNYNRTRVKLLQYPGGDFFIFKDLNKIFMKADANVFVEVFGGDWQKLMFRSHR